MVNDKFVCCRSGFCNFMHLKPISRKLRQELYGRSVKGPVGRQTSCGQGMTFRRES